MNSKVINAPEGVNSCIERLVEASVPSRVYSKDASLYNFSCEAEECAKEFMGWTDLATRPPVSLKAISRLAKNFRKEGITSAILIGQGGSTQAAMTMTKMFGTMPFFVLDSDSPVRLRSILGKCDIEHTLVIASSKSGSTLELRLILAAVRQVMSEVLTEEALCAHLVAITDPGSPLEKQARDEGWAAILYGEPTVGGRFSALSVFGLFPAALAGLPVKAMMRAAAKEEQACAENAAHNPAVQLAAFLYESYALGRNKVALVTQKRGRTLGLWIEQLIAESTGKDGQGILPYLEPDTLLLAAGHGELAAQDRLALPLGDRAVCSFRTDTTPLDAKRSFSKALSYIYAGIPQYFDKIKDPESLARVFVRFEYATAMVGYLMKVCPFDQPDVASAKKKVTEILEAGLPNPSFTEEFLGAIPMGIAEVRLSPCCEDDRSIYSALRTLFSTISPGDYFALNAFLPFMGEGRREALEAIREEVAQFSGVAACLEVGPRFLHSTGQLQKGGPNQGVFLVLSADEADDIALKKQSAKTLGALAQAQATGDALTLAERNRRVVHLHLPNNYGITLRYLAALVREVLSDITKEREAKLHSSQDFPLKEEDPTGEPQSE